MAPVKTTQGTFRYRVTSPSRSRVQSARRRIRKQSIRTAVCASADQKNILRAQGENDPVLCSMHVDHCKLFSLFLSQYFLFSHFLFLFCFYTRYQKARLLSPHATTGALPYLLEHSLTLQEKLVRISFGGETKIKYARSMAHTEIYTHTRPTYVSAGFMGLVGGEGGDEERDGNNNNDDTRRSSYDGQKGWGVGPGTPNERSQPMYTSHYS